MLLVGKLSVFTPNDVKKKEEKKKEKRLTEDGGEENMIGGWRKSSAVFVGPKPIAS
jgi:hypothetical protein